jgi:Putative Flp pilus-assembly TadE/G-like
MRRLTDRAAGERGGVLVMAALWMPVLLIFLTFVVDVANWFVHKRHLQMQADSGVFAGAQQVGFSCDDAAVADAATRYSGTQWNAQVGGTPDARVFRRLNSKTFHAQAGTPKPETPDDTVEAPPCEAAMIDLKLTETDLPWFFPPAGSLIEHVVPFVNAQARVSFFRLDSLEGALPVGVPDVNPQAARAYFVNEKTGAVLGSTPLTKVGTSNGLAVWDNVDAPLPVTFDSADADVGVAIALGGAASTTCGEPLVECFDAGAPKLASGLPSTGIVRMRGWSAAGSGAQPGDPVLRDVTLLAGTCPDPYFSALEAACSYGVRARVDFGTGDPIAGVGATLTARAGGTAYPLAYDAVSGYWSADSAIPLAASSGPQDVTLEWAETKGTWNGQSCTTSNGNKCKGSFGVVQRAFSATAPRSGPIRVAQVSENGIGGANSFERCSAVQTSCTHDLVVRIGIKGSLANASAVDDPIVALRVAGGTGSQTQALDCDNAKDLTAELATGCTPGYRRNTGTACPPANVHWGSPQPYPCVAVTTGQRPNQVAEGLNTRILGSAKPTACTSPNRWSEFPDLDPGDPRMIQVFLTPYGAFSGNGTDQTIPVTDFATFYVTGWTSSGQGFANPCQGNGDDPVPDNDPGYIVGHFVKYIQSLNPGTGSTPCDMDAFGSCMAELTR